MLTNSQTDLLARWNAAKTALAVATAAEKELRAEVIKLFSTETNEMKSGVENIDLGFDKWELKITHKLNYKLADKDAVNAALASITQSMEGGRIIAERLVKWEPELSVSEYNKLDGAQRTLINKVLTITPATKAIEIKQRAR
jgi:hypothetical protein